MRVFKRQGVWYGDYIDPINATRRRVSLKLTGSKAGATAALADVLASYKALRAEDGKPRITLRDCLSRYVEWLEVEHPPSVQGQRSRNRKTLGEVPAVRTRKKKSGTEAACHHLNPDMMIDTLTVPMINDLVLARRREGDAAQTIWHEVKGIRAAVRRVAKAGYAVPVAMLDGRIRDAWSEPQRREKTRWLTAEEFNKLLTYLDEHGRPAERDVALFLGMTGCRWSEAVSLTWDRVDLAGQTAEVFGSKTGAHRFVGLPAQVAEMLRTRPTLHASDPVFRAPNAKAIAKGMNDLGFNADPRLVAERGKATVHTLRHTYASLLVQHGASLQEVQTALGHSTLRMTQRYAQLEITATARKLAAIIGGAV